MKKHDIIIPITTLSAEDLNLWQADLIEQAKQATRGSYAPYSHFCVGAAMLLEDGTIVRGANQENAAFSSGTCAERSACFAAGANHKGVPVKAIAIAARKGDEFQAEPISPCGACRQALLEYENLQHTPIKVLLYGTSGTLLLPSVASLLPLCFTSF